MKKCLVIIISILFVLNFSIIQSLFANHISLNTLRDHNYQDTLKQKINDQNIILNGNWDLVVGKIRNQYPTLNHARFVHASRKATTLLELNGKNYNDIRVITHIPETGDLIILDSISTIDPATKIIRKISGKITYIIK